MHKCWIWKDHLKGHFTKFKVNLKYLDFFFYRKLCNGLISMLLARTTLANIYNHIVYFTCVEFITNNRDQYCTYTMNSHSHTLSLMLVIMKIFVFRMIGNNWHFKVSFFILLSLTVRENFTSKSLRLPKRLKTWRFVPDHCLVI